jgi:hypothetical protein
MLDFVHAGEIQPFSTKHPKNVISNMSDIRLHSMSEQILRKIIPAPLDLDHEQPVRGIAVLQ